MKDIVIALVSIVFGALIGLAIAQYYYKKALLDAQAQAQEQSRINNLILQGIESIGTIKYARGTAGNITGVSIELKGHSVSRVSGVGTLTVTPTEGH